MIFDKALSLDSQKEAVERFAESLLKMQGVKSPGGCQLDPSWQRIAPSILQSIYLKNGGPAGPLVGAFHRFEDTLETRDGKVVFCGDPQGESSWALVGDGPDPEVWVSCDGNSNIWTSQQVGLCEFLIQLMIFEFIGEAPFRRGYVTAPREDVERVLAELEKLPLGSWTFPNSPTTFYQSGPVFAFSHPNSDEDAYLAIGSADELALCRLDAVNPEAEWDWAE